jgi:hypothetical protein
MKLIRLREELSVSLTATPELVRERYEYWRTLGDLPVPATSEVEFKTSSIPGGLFATTSCRFDLGRTKVFHFAVQVKAEPTNMTITVSTKLKFSPHHLDGVILHEMVHASLYAERYSKHGHSPIFVDRLREFEKKVGRKIPIGYGRDEEEGGLPGIDDFAAKEVLLAVETRNGKRWVAMVSTRDEGSAETWVASRSAMYRSAKFEVFKVKTGLASARPVHKTFRGIKAFYDLKKESQLDEMIGRGEKVAP